MTLPPDGSPPATPPPANPAVTPRTVRTPDATPLATGRSVTGRGAYWSAVVPLYLGGLGFIGLMIPRLRQDHWRVELRDGLEVFLCFVVVVVGKMMIDALAEAGADRRFRLESRNGGLGGGRTGYMISPPLAFLAAFILLVTAATTVAVYEPSKKQSETGDKKGASKGATGTPAPAAAQPQSKPTPSPTPTPTPPPSGKGAPAC